MLKTLLCIAAGSGLGGVARYLVGRWVQSLSGAALFPWGTFAVNVAGCFIIGLIYGAIDHGTNIPQDVKIFLTVGFCGGFTTFSTFIHENYMLFDSSEFPALALYAGASFTVGLLLAYAGHWIARSI
ncbi:fluoride efflux transporter CrcB [uncultured Duncaniella sp.]|uniref:fluoride efflux transporter CrcB n=1 Tax=uncultured Duncaniella sp. TaxID=2768039 RepID=UPI0025B3B137|nr:fluoride efflux transporter CrcB [uncultured Duncaniella sp.]